MKNLSKVRESLITLLKDEVATITFTKKDGSERVLKGTLMPSLLPEFDSSKPKRKRAVNEEVLAVFDTEKSAFRSFRIDSVTKFESESFTVEGSLV